MDLVRFMYVVDLPEIDADHGVIFVGGATCGVEMSWSWPGRDEVGKASIYLEHLDSLESPAVRRSMMRFSNRGRPLEDVPQATSAWIQIGDRRVPMSAADLNSAEPNEIEIDHKTAVELLTLIAAGAFPMIGMRIAGTNAERLVRAINPVDPARATEIHAAIVTWRARSIG